MVLEAYRRVFSLLSPRDRRRFVLVIAMMLAAGAAEVAGIAAIIPLLAVVAEPDVVHGGGLLSGLHDRGGFSSTDGCLGALCLAVSVVVIGSIAVRVATFHLIARFPRGMVLTPSQALLSRSLRNPHKGCPARHSADLGKTLLSETKEVASGSITSAMRFVSDLIVCAALLVFLVRLDPLGALGTGEGWAWPSRWPGCASRRRSKLLFRSSARMRFHRPALESLVGELHEPTAPGPPPAGARGAAAALCARAARRLLPPSRRSARASTTSWRGSPRATGASPHPGRVTA